jgi:hypothetical protein
LLSLFGALSLPVGAGIKHAYDRAVFVYLRHPDLPMQEFAAGRLGIPHPRHARIYHYITYRVSG